MTEKPFDVVGFGNALVDIIARCDDSFITGQGLDKGSMRLIEDAEATMLYALMGPAIEASGGTTPNTCVGVASLGGKVAFMGRIAKDQFGEVFAHDLRAAGVTTLSQDGLTPAQQLAAVNEFGAGLVRDQQACWSELKAELAAAGVEIA